MGLNCEISLCYSWKKSYCMTRMFRVCWSVHPTVGRKSMKSTRGLLGHSLLRSLVRSHRTLVHLLCTPRYTRALRWAHSFARSLTRWGAHGKEVYVLDRNASISDAFNQGCTDARKMLTRPRPWLPQRGRVQGFFTASRPRPRANASAGYFVAKHTRARESHTHSHPNLYSQHYGCYFS